VCACGTIIPYRAVSLFLTENFIGRDITGNAYVLLITPFGNYYDHQFLNVPKQVRLRFPVNDGR